MSPNDFIVDDRRFQGFVDRLLIRSNRLSIIPIKYILREKEALSRYNNLNLLAAAFGDAQGLEDFRYDTNPRPVGP